MFKLFRWCSTLAILSVGSLLATNHPCPGKWGTSVDFVYLKPSVDDTYFVIKSGATSLFPDGTRNNNDFHFRPGFRVGGVYALCECNQELQFYYTRLSAKQSKTVSGAHLWATIGRPDEGSTFEDYAGTAQSQLQNLYQRVDANFAQQTLCCCGLDLYLQLGMEFASFHLNEHYTYAITGGATGDIFAKSKTWGLGPQLGMSAEYELCECTDFLPGRLSLTGLGSGSLLASKSWTKNRQTGPANLNVHDQPTWRLIPALHARFGLNYATTIECYNANFEIGYEFNTYVRGTPRVEFPDDVADASCFNNFGNYDLQGLYISAAVQF